MERAGPSRLAGRLRRDADKPQGRGHGDEARNKRSSAATKRRAGLGWAGRQRQPAAASSREIRLDSRATRQQPSVRPHPRVPGLPRAALMRRAAPRPLQSAPVRPRARWPGTSSPTIGALLPPFLPDVAASPPGHPPRSVPPSSRCLPSTIPLPTLAMTASSKSTDALDAKDPGLLAEKPVVALTAFEDNASGNILAEVRGEKQHLSKLALLGMSFAILNTWAASSISIYIGLADGGSTSVIYGMIAATLCSFCVAASLSELCHVFPTAGASPCSTASAASADDPSRAQVHSTTGSLPCRTPRLLWAASARTSLAFSGLVAGSCSQLLVPPWLGRMSRRASASSTRPTHRPTGSAS